MSDVSRIREWHLYVDDMIAFAERALTYAEELDQVGFFADRLRYDATLRNLELIGEAADKVPDGVRMAKCRILRYPITISQFRP